MTTEDKLPQRFRWKKAASDFWMYGCCIPQRFHDGSIMWLIRAGNGFSWFEDDPWTSMGYVLGDIRQFEWLDNDYGWN